MQMSVLNFCIMVSFGRNQLTKRQILLFYLIGTSAAFIVFVLCTRIVHQTFA
jgi:hypothetical protein